MSQISNAGLFLRHRLEDAQPVFTLRCTQRLLRRLPDSVVAEPPEPTTVLGNWYAKLVTIERRPYVIAVSERTFLAAFLPLSPGRTLQSRLREQIGEVLVRLRIGEAAFAAEMEAMQTSVLAKTASRQAMGVLVDFAHMAQSRPDLVTVPTAMSIYVSHTPCGPLEMAFPDEETVQAFGASDKA